MLRYSNFKKSLAHGKFQGGSPSYCYQRKEIYLDRDYYYVTMITMILQHNDRRLCCKIKVKICEAKKPIFHSSSFPQMSLTKFL